MVRGFLLLAVPAIVAILALAWHGVASEPAGDAGVAVDRVKAIARTCAACHGTEGRYETGIPTLAGKPEAVLSAQLLAFKRDEMPGATVMPRLMRGYGEDELRAVARYFSGLEAR